ncbi:MAG: 16S rRNA (guanine(527)-N(7))-methyltransferase RsmG [Rickettsiales bacterium]
MIKGYAKVDDNHFDLLNSHLKVSHETYEKLSTYHDLLIKWQSKINLISNDTVSDIWSRHILDSLQLVPHIPSLDNTMMDIGTGAGFPGMALAIYGYNNIHLVESDGKKIVFLREVSRVTNSPVTIHHQRVEQVEIPKCDIILSRACSDLNKLLNLSIKNVSHETTSLFHKGKNYSIEIEDAKKHWSFDHEITKSITDPNGVIVKLSNICRRTS